jgi:hypothetical protein
VIRKTTGLAGSGFAVVNKTVSAVIVMSRVMCWLCGDPPLIPAFAASCDTILSYTNETIAVFATKHDLKMAVGMSGDEVVCDTCLCILKRLDQTWSELDFYTSAMKERINKSELDFQSSPVLFQLFLPEFNYCFSNGKRIRV